MYVNRLKENFQEEVQNYNKRGVNTMAIPKQKENIKFNYEIYQIWLNSSKK